MRVAFTRTCTGSSGGESLIAFSSRFDECPLDLRRVDLDGREVGARVHDDSLRVGELVHRLREQLVRCPELGTRYRRPGLQPREIEEVLDEPLQAHVLRADRLQQLDPVLVGQGQLAALEPVERLLDRGQRRAQIVRDGLDDGGLDRVATSERLGLERVAGQPLPLAGDGQQRGEGRQEPPLDGEGRLLALARVERPDLPPVDGERMGRLARALTHPPAERDAHRRNAEYFRRPLLDALELVVQPRAAQQLGGDVCEQRRLELALLGLGSLSAGAGSQAADHDCRHHVDEQREPVAPVRESERVDRRQEEEVEGEHARDGDDHCVGGAPEQRDREHGEHVEHAEAERRDEVVEDRDRLR